MIFAVKVARVLGESWTGGSLHLLAVYYYYIPATVRYGQCNVALSGLCLLLYLMMLC
jgi:hypothetical protein